MSETTIKKKRVDWVRVKENSLIGAFNIIIATIVLGVWSFTANMMEKLDTVSSNNAAITQVLTKEVAKNSAAIKHLEVEMVEHVPKVFLHAPTVAKDVVGEEASRIEWQIQQKQE